MTERTHPGASWAVNTFRATRAANPREILGSTAANLSRDKLTNEHFNPPRGGFGGEHFSWSRDNLAIPTAAPGGGGAG
jgi:hypothetical protein